MLIFKEHKISAGGLLRVVPEAFLSHLSENAKTDYYSKVLHWKKLFCQLMYGISENDGLSQRTLEDTFNDPAFKVLFNPDRSESVRRSSISERLSQIDSDCFKQIYACIYEQFSRLYSSTERGKRVDSSMACETGSKLLEEGIGHGNAKKPVKCSMAFDGILPCEAKVFTGSGYAGEETALPEAM